MLWSSSKHPGHSLFLILDCIGTCQFWRPRQQQSLSIHWNSYCCAKRRVSLSSFLPKRSKREPQVFMLHFSLSNHLQTQLLDQESDYAMGNRKTEKEGKKQGRMKGLQKLFFAHIISKQHSPTGGWRPFLWVILPKTYYPTNFTLSLSITRAAIISLFLPSPQLHSSERLKEPQDYVSKGTELLNCI